MVMMKRRLIPNHNGRLPYRRNNKDNLLGEPWFLIGFYRERDLFLRDRALRNCDRARRRVKSQ